MSTLIKLRRDSAANWAAADPVLQLGEPGYDTTNNELRIGDGTTAWSGLTPIAGGGGGGLPLANGSSNFNIATSGGNATVTTGGTYTWTLDTAGNLTVPGNIVGTTTIDIDNRATGNIADIRLFSADDILIQARDRDAGSTSEGGDINIYAGDSAENGDTSAGDVQIFAGNGGAANVDYGGTGGLVTIRAGDGGPAIGNSGYSASSGGDLTIRAGDAGANGGNIDLGSGGGVVYIYGGSATGNNQAGGAIILTSGTGGPNSAGGNIEVVVPAGDTGPGGTWTFNNAGNLTLPAGTAINTPTGSNGNIVINPDGSGYLQIQGAANTKVFISSDVPDAENRIELDTYGANLGQTGGGVFVGTYRRTGGPSQLDDRLASFAGIGTENGTTLGNVCAKITLDAAQNWSVGNTPSHISFWTTPSGTNVPVENMRLGPVGNLMVYNGNVVVSTGKVIAPLVVTTSRTVSALPAANATPAGTRAFVTDADSRTFDAIVGGSAGNAMPVWCDGVDWRIG